MHDASNFYLFAFQRIKSLYLYKKLIAKEEVLEGMGITIANHHFG
jgi:hypothetical protein